MHKNSGKGACLIALFLTLCASCTPSCRQWQVEEAVAAYPCYKLGKLFLPPQNCYTGIELELSKCNGDIRMYGNVFSVPFPWNPCEPSLIEVVVTIDDIPSSFQADCLQGGQRLLLPPEAAQLIINALIDCKNVDLKAGRYSSTILVENFPVLFADFSSS